MSERSDSSPQDGKQPAGEGDRSGPPLARELAGVAPGYTWKFGEGNRPPGADPAAPADPAATPEASAGNEEPPAEESETDRLRTRVRHLTAALEDVVALALSGAEYKERAIMMHRRAVAALSGPPDRPRPH